MAATLLPNRTRLTASRTPAGHAQLHVRWDRVCLLLALVAVLAIVVTHAVVVAVRGDPSAPAAQTAAIPASGQPVTTQPTCPKPAPGVSHWAIAACSDQNARQIN